MQIATKIFRDNSWPKPWSLRVAVKGKFQRDKAKSPKKKKGIERKKLEAVRDIFLLPSLGASVI